MVQRGPKSKTSFMKNAFLEIPRKKNSLKEFYLLIIWIHNVADLYYYHELSFNISHINVNLSCNVHLFTALKKTLF